MAYQEVDSYGRQMDSGLYSMQTNYNNPQNAGIIPQSINCSLELHKETIHPSNGYSNGRYHDQRGSFQGQQQPTPIPTLPNQPPPNYHAPGAERLYTITTPSQSRTKPSFMTPNKLMDSQLTPQSPPLDYPLLLLSMAEEYIAAAHSRGSMVDIVERETEMQAYYRLLATGLGCLEAVLRKCRLQPDVEATVRLRYATILHEETENNLEAEEALSKGISIADRYKLFDLKYNMQHLLSRILFQSNPKAAFKFLDGTIEDVEAYQHIAWVYAFRFLKASLHLELSSPQDISSALMILRSISSMAKQHSDKAILAIATTMEAFTCLRESNTSESFEQAQRALASARSLQLDPTIGNLRYLKLLISFVDLCCHLHQFGIVRAMQKMQIMQDALSTVAGGKGWMEDGSIALPLPGARMASCKTRTGIVKVDNDGSLVLMLNWFPEDDIYNIGYFLSGVTMAYRNTSDGRKSEQMLLEGIRRQDCKVSPLHCHVTLAQSSADAQKRAGKLATSIMLATSQQLWRQQMSCYMRVYLAFILCARSSWVTAQQHLSNVQGTMTSWADCPPDLQHLTQYLSATIAQGTGDLPSAIQIYRNHTISTSTSFAKVAHFSEDISLVCTLNALLILRDPCHPDHHMFPTLIGRLRTLCLNHPNRQIQSAYHLLHSVLPGSTTITATKQSLQSALQAAKATSNNQLMCMVLNIMSWKFFRGVVGEQAEKSAMASQSLARKVGLGLWMCVSAGAVGKTLESAGRTEEAEEAMKEGWKRAAELPVNIREAMGYLTPGDTGGHIDHGPG
ncbi:MAG: hypothetical protein Q9163_005273 [Psora crenata]